MTRTTIAIALAAAMLLVVTAAAQPQAPEFTSAMADGEAALKVRRWQDALAAFERANAAMGKKSPAAMGGIARAYQGLGDFRQRAAACKDALKLVGTDEALAAILHNQRGLALFAQANKNTDKIIKEAEGEFRAAVALTAAPSTATYNLGFALMRQGLDDEGLELMRRYVASGARTPELESAKRMIENPRRAREAYAPEFRFTVPNGPTVDLKSLEGKTVFIDFWGQWCGPCRAMTPELVSLYRRYKNDPNFVMIGISSDTAADEPKWREYVDKNAMAWTQFIDLRHQVLNAFQVHVFPTGIVISPEGIILLREEGNSSGGVNVIDGIIKKSLKAGRDESRE